jgi:hypothetical protein
MRPPRTQLVPELPSKTLKIIHLERSPLLFYKSNYVRKGSFFNTVFPRSGSASSNIARLNVIQMTPHRNPGAQPA